MVRNLLILGLAWALLLQPALCTGGWLLHPCDCGSAIACDHEADCASDPCEIGIVRTSSGWVYASDRGMAKSVLPAVAEDSESVLARQPSSVRPSSSPRLSQSGLPFPASDLPLLI